MDTEMTYEEFDKELRKEYPTITCRTIMELHKLEYPDQYTVADTPPPVPQWTGQQNQEVENTMSYNDECTMCIPTPKSVFGRKAMVSAPIANAQVIAAVPVESTQRDYAIERIKVIGRNHEETLRTQFYMDSQMPKTFLELEAMIKAGDYTVSNRAKDEDAAYMPLFYCVTFGKPADKEGFKAAKEVLKAAAQKALDKATLGTVDALEGVIDDFEAWTLPTA